MYFEGVFISVSKYPSKKKGEILNLLLWLWGILCLLLIAPTLPERVQELGASVGWYCFSTGVNWPAPGQGINNLPVGYWFIWPDKLPIIALVLNYQLLRNNLPRLLN
jgi:hypothetical protein